MRRLLLAQQTFSRLPLAFLCSPLNAARYSSEFQHPSSHRLTSSSGNHTLVQTCCGRIFDPNLHAEVLHAVCDHRWMQAIQRSMAEDAEYVQMLRTEGGVGTVLSAMTSSISNDDEFMVQLIEKLKTDRKVALSLCALQESYAKLRKRRDEQDTREAAEGRSPLNEMRSMNSPFGTKGM